MIREFVNEELEMMWKGDAVMAYFMAIYRHIPRMTLESQEIYSHDIRSPT